MAKKAAKPAAKKPRAGKKSTPGQKPVKQTAAAETIVYRYPSENDLNNLLRRDRSARSQISEITGTLRERIADAKEKKNLHPKAFAFIKQIDKMEAEKAREFWYHVEKYMEMTGQLKKIESAPALSLDGEDNTDDAEDDAQVTGETGESDTVSEPQFGKLSVVGGASQH